MRATGGTEGFAAWLKQRNRADNTIRKYVADLRSCTGHPKGLLGKLREPLAPKTLRRTYSVLRAWGRYTQDQALMAELDDIILPPARRMTAKTPMPTEDWLTLMRMLPKAKDVHPPARWVIEVMALRGLRVGDVLRLWRWEIEEGLKIGVLVGEAKKRARQEYSVRPIAAPLKKLLERPDWRQVVDLILPEDSEAEDRMAAGGAAIWRALKRVAAEAGLDPSTIHPHRLRRTYATEFLAQVGGDIEKLRQHMGWADLSTAAGYVDHDRREELDAAAEEMLRKKRS